MNEKIGRTYEAQARMLLTSVAEPGDRRISELVQVMGAEGAVRHLTEERELGLPQERIASIIDDAVRHGLTFVCPGDGVWPTGLDDLGSAAPLGLWVAGDPRPLARLRSDGISIVGARAASSYGEHITGEIASELARQGRIVVSGLAYGIDGTAHRAALNVGGITVAFLAGGLDRTYPAGHNDLRQRIVNGGGAVVSEVPVRWAPTRHRFLARNRLIAASTPVSVVMEAGYRSGSLNELSHASDLGRAVGAVPGPLTSVTSAGTNAAIRDGRATLVTSAEDVLDLAGRA